MFSMFWYQFFHFSFNKNLKTNTTTSVNVSSPLIGGLGLDNVSGVVYLATQAGIMNYNPGTTVISNVYANADFTIPWNCH